MVKVIVHPWWHQKLSILQYQRGLNFLRGMAYQQAISAFAEALRWHPRPSDVFVMRGVAYAKLGQVAIAFADYNRAIALDPTDGRAYAKRGLLHASQGNHDQALQDWDQALIHGVKDAEIHYQRGLRALAQGQTAVALGEFDRAIALNPNAAEVYFQRGNLRLRQGDEAGAIRDWERAICNDFSQDEAKLRLQALRQKAADQQLTAQLQDILATCPGLDSAFQVTFQVEVRQLGQGKQSYLEVLLERPLGTGVDYRILMQQLQAALVQLNVQGIYQFELVSRIQGSHFQDWRQRGQIYAQQPCPPRHWKFVLALLLLCPPVGLSALLCNYQVVTLYQRGYYPLARQASELTKTLCYCGVGVSSLLGLLLVGHLLWGGGEHQTQPTAGEQPQTLSPTERLR